MDLLSILPSAPVSASSNIAFLAATPNLNLAPATRSPSKPTGDDEKDEGAFAIVRVQTSGDLGDRPRLAVEGEF